MNYQVIDNIQAQRERNWIFIADYLAYLCMVIGRNPVGSSRRIMEHSKIIAPLGYTLNEEEMSAFVKVLNSYYGEHIYEIFRRRSTLYFLRLLRCIERFPPSTISKNDIQKWRFSLSGLLRDMDSLIDPGTVLKQVEHFAGSTLSLSRFITAWHDPELVTAIYLLEISEKEGRGASYVAESYLVERARHELEVLIDPASKNLFSDLLDDESNVWWGIFTLFRLELGDFSLHQARGIKGFISILDRLIERKSILYPTKDVAKRELTFEVQGEYKTKLNIINTCFMIADILDDLNIRDYSERIRDFAILQQEPFISGEKLRMDEHLYFLCLECEVWGRILAWRSGGGPIDLQGQKIMPGFYRNVMNKPLQKKF